MDNFFTVASFGTLVGCVSAVVVIMNVMRHAFNWGPRWMGLLVSLVIAVVALKVTSGFGASHTAELGTLRYLIALMNGCLIYTSAFGVQNNAVVELAPGGLRLQSVEDDESQARLRAWSRW
jgi:hypothetical protein